MTTISLSIIYSDAADVNAASRKNSSMQKNNKAAPFGTACEVYTTDLRLSCNAVAPLAERARHGLTEFCAFMAHVQVWT